MKSIPKILLASCLCIFSYLASYSQRAHGHVHKRVNQPTKKVVVHKQGPKRTVIVKRSVYRPAKVVVYHPIWHPTHTFHRRWVFFPKYNLQVALSNAFGAGRRGGIAEGMESRGPTPPPG